MQKIVTLVLRSSNHSVFTKKQISFTDWHQQLSKKVLHFKKLHFTIHGKGIFFLSYCKFFCRMVKLWSYGLDISSKIFLIL